METASKTQRSELWNKIFEKVKELPRAEVNGDAVDHSSLTTILEDLFIKESSQQIGSSIDAPYYIGVKIITGGVLQSNDNQKLIKEFKAQGFTFDGEPITQSNDEVCWTLMKKNNKLISEKDGK